MSIETRTPVLTHTLAQEGDADADLGAAGGRGRIGENNKNNTYLQCCAYTCQPDLCTASLA